MKSLFALIANTINKRPFVVAGLIVAVLLFAMYGATMTTMKTGSDTYLDKTNRSDPFSITIQIFSGQIRSSLL